MLLNKIYSVFFHCKLKVVNVRCFIPILLNITLSDCLFLLISRWYVWCERDWPFYHFAEIYFICSLCVCVFLQHFLGLKLRMNVTQKSRMSWLDWIFVPDFLEDHLYVASHRWPFDNLLYISIYLFLHIKSIIIKLRLDILLGTLIEWKMF